jgi:hypothetical protein
LLVHKQARNDERHPHPGKNDGRLRKNDGGLPGRTTAGFGKNDGPLSLDPPFLGRESSEAEI